MTIETKRLMITAFTPDMAQAVHENSLDEDNRRFVPDEVFETVEVAQETIDFLISVYGDFEEPQVYPILTKDKNENVGYVQLVPLSNGEWEVGYHIGEKYRNNGYATEAVTAFLPVMAQKIGVKEVYGICVLENKASIRVMEKCGFEKESEGLGEYQGEEREIYTGVWRAKK